MSPKAAARYMTENVLRHLMGATDDEKAKLLGELTAAQRRVTVKRQAEEDRQGRQPCPASITDVLDETR